MVMLLLLIYSILFTSKIVKQDQDEFAGAVTIRLAQVCLDCRNIQYSMVMLLLFIYSFLFTLKIVEQEQDELAEAATRRLVQVCLRLPYSSVLDGNKGCCC